MKVTYGIGKVKKKVKNAVLAIGVFDGLHLGHQALIKKAVKKAQAINGQAVVMTFSPHPVHVLSPNVYMPYIVSIPYRIKLIERLGVAKCVVVRFSKKFSRQAPEAFIKSYLVDKINPKEIFVGDDFRFGQDRVGTLELFRSLGKKYGFKVNVLKPVLGGVKKISSTKIRELIASGKFAQAKKILGRDVSLMGKVIRGDGRGRLLGYPTANLDIDHEILPSIGVYAVKVELGNKIYKGMANIGHRPSFSSDNQQVFVEVHLFNFNKSIYGKTLIVHFIKKLRNERIFPTRDKLIAQIGRDAIAAKNIFSSKS